MNRIRFSKPAGQVAEPVSPTAPSEARQPAAEPAASATSHVATASKDDRDVIEHVQMRLLAEPSNPNGKKSLTIMSAGSLRWYPSTWS
jgi:hypothetical protein